MKILLLEDELMLNDAISEYLKGIGHMVQSFTDGEEVINNVDMSFDLLIMDINVPKKDGFEILEDLNKKKIYIPTIYISALIDIEEPTIGLVRSSGDRSLAASETNGPAATIISILGSLVAASNCLLASEASQFVV